MGGQIAIAGMKPGGLSQLPIAIQAKKRVALYSPAALLAQFSGQHVSDGIEIGGSIQSPPHQVIAGVHDNCELFGGNDLPQAVDELGASSAPSQNRYHAALFFRA